MRYENAQEAIGIIQQIDNLELLKENISEDWLTVKIELDGREIFSEAATKEMDGQFSVETGIFIGHLRNSVNDKINLLKQKLHSL